MAKNKGEQAPRTAETKRSTSATGKDRISAGQVSRYLRRNPTFLNDHPELLDVLETPARDMGDGVTDLQHWMTYLPTAWG